MARKQFRGFARLARYAGDFVVYFENNNEARRFSEMLTLRLAKFGLKIAEGKSRMIAFGRTAWETTHREGERVASFDFLGFTHFYDKTRKGKFKVGRKTLAKKFAQKMMAMNDWMKKVRNLVKLSERWKVFRMKLIGHYRYYSISGNMRALKEFHYLTSELAYKWINRRSQKLTFSHSYFTRYLKTTLPAPKIYHLTYALSS